ncbi:MAG: hydantoinase/oxoprolinase family protein, partial [Gammaproteobacteria bacterium]|nr:hydantoinase/oxoprolinase family protein [Gammaproteobacteria bacterium]
MSAPANGGSANGQRVAFDIGGTFTDVIVLDSSGRLHATKVLSLMDELGSAIATCIRAVDDAEPVKGFVHGTTIASNAVIEGTTARTALITTAGFRDELEIRGQRRPNIYDANWDRLAPLVPRALRFEVAERILGNATVDTPLDDASLREALDGALTADV